MSDMFGSFGGAVIQASYVHRDPPLLLRLADGHIPCVVEPPMYVVPSLVAVGGS